MNRHEHSTTGVESLVCWHCEGAWMWIGDVVADRFVIECPAVSGGMSSVFRAMDRVTGERVAVKVMDDDAPSAGDRFRLETNVLSELSHPAIVRYIAHGETE